jgi:hypothetical protein
MPRLAPVTMAVFPASFPIFVSSNLELSSDNNRLVRNPSPPDAFGVLHE